AAAAACDPDLHRGLRLCRDSRRARARTIGAASGFRLALRRRLLVSERPLTRRCNSPFRFRALSIRLSRRARDVSDSGPAIHRARAHARRATMGTRAAHHFAVGAARNKSEYLGVHTLTLSIFTTWLNRASLAGAACVMKSIR